MLEDQTQTPCLAGQKGLLDALGSVSPAAMKIKVLTCKHKEERTQEVP